MLDVAIFAGPIGSPYPGTPIALAFICFFIAVGVRLALVRRTREYGTPGRPQKGANAFVTATVILFVAVVLWVVLAKGR